MYCRNCGQQLPDNSAFCNVCGARMDGGQANYGGAGYPQMQGYNRAPAYNAGYPQQPQNSYYAQPQQREQAHSREEERPKEVPDGRYASRLVLLYYLLGVVVAIAEIAHIDQDSYSAAAGFIYMIASIGCLSGDAKELKRCGYKISKLWYVIGFIWSTPYLFVRAKKTGTGMGYFVLRIIPTLVALVMVFVMYQMGVF